jgi:vacuolar-type H+-ATPase subunit D/Vma8
VVGVPGYYLALTSVHKTIEVFMRVPLPQMRMGSATSADDDSSYKLSQRVDEPARLLHSALNETVLMQALRAVMTAAGAKLTDRELSRVLALLKYDTFNFDNFYTSLMGINTQ